MFCLVAPSLINCYFNLITFLSITIVFLLEALVYIPESNFYYKWSIIGYIKQFVSCEYLNTYSKSKSGIFYS